MRVTVPAPSPLRQVRLYGALGRKFGRVHHLAVGSPREAMQALGVVLPGFATHVLEHNEPGYHVFIGKRGQGSIGAEQLEQPVSAREPICVVPAVAGAKSGGLFQTILGIALIGLTAWNPLGAFVGGGAYGGSFAVFSGAGKLGAYLALGGVVQMIAAHSMGSPEPKAAGLPSYHFDGPVNTTQEGLPVPLRYGRTIFGPAVISAGISSEDIKMAAAPAPFVNPLRPAHEPLDPVNGGSEWNSSEGSP